MGGSTVPSRRLAMLTATIVLAVAACSSSASPTPSGTAASSGASAPAPAVGGSNAVEIKNLAFNPASISVKVGSKVTWTNNDSATHTVTLDDNSVDSGNVAAGSSFDHTFATAGSFAYHCKIHSSMHGTVVVMS